MKPTLILVEDHVIVRDGLVRLLEKEFRILGTAQDGHAAVALCRELQPDAAVVDISIPLLNGVEATRQIRIASPRTRVVILTQHNGRPYIRAAFDAGVAAYVVKQSAAAELIQALREALEGRQYVSPRLIPTNSGPAPENRNVAALFATELTPRQREVLQLVAEGKSAKEIAAILGISAKTAEFHKAGLMQELGLHTTAELTRYAIEHGIVESQKNGE